MAWFLCIILAVLELRDPTAFASQVLELTACATSAQFLLVFEDNWVNVYFLGITFPLQVKHKAVCRYRTTRHHLSQASPAVLRLKGGWKMVFSGTEVNHFLTDRQVTFGLGSPSLAPSL